MRNCKELEVWMRIQVSIAAYAYEFENDVIISDSEFDAMCSKIDLSIDTSNREMDRWFRDNFNPSTGMWIKRHPHLGRLKRIYEVHYAL